MPAPKAATARSRPMPAAPTATATPRINAVEPDWPPHAADAAASRPRSSAADFAETSYSRRDQQQPSQELHPFNDASLPRPLYRIA
jgi:hypothetical protein